MVAEGVCCVEHYRRNNSVVVGSLEPYTKYKILVSSLNAYIEGPSSQPEVYCTTLEDGGCTSNTLMS